MKYVPHPIDLTNIEIDKVLKNDLEIISKNVHETWAEQRKLRGWEYGESFDAEGKKHPCMVEYDDLSELEKDMDRATVMQTVKMLLWLGYKIEKKG